MQLRPTGGRARRHPGLQTQMREDLLDHWLFKDRRDDLQRAAAVRVARHVDLEDALEQLGPAQPPRALVRTGRLALGGWSTTPGAFAARAVLPDGTLPEFSSAFELAQLLRSVGWLPVPAPRGGPGLR